MAIVPFILIIVFTPNHYFDVEATVKFKQECSEKVTSVALQETNTLTEDSERGRNHQVIDDNN